MEPFAVTLAGYTIFVASLIVASGAAVAIRLKGEATPRRPYVLALVASVVVGGMSIANTGALREARLRSQQFEQYCDSAHVTVNRTVSGVTSAYFDGEQCLGYLNSGYLSSCEKPAYRKDVEPDKPFEREFAGGSMRIERIRELQSEYAVIVKAITTDRDTQLGIGGAEKKIIDRKNGEVLATARWFMLSKSSPYPTCPSTGFRSLEMYVLGLGPEHVRQRIADEVDQARRELASRNRGAN